MSDTLKVLLGFVLGFLFMLYLCEGHSTLVEKRGYWTRGDQIYKLVKVD